MSACVFFQKSYLHPCSAAHDLLVKICFYVIHWYKLLSNARQPFQTLQHNQLTKPRPSTKSAAPQRRWSAWRKCSSFLFFN